MIRRAYCDRYVLSAMEGKRKTVAKTLRSGHARRGNQVKKGREDGGTGNPEKRKDPACIGTGSFMVCNLWQLLN